MNLFLHFTGFCYRDFCFCISLGTVCQCGFPCVRLLYASRAEGAQLLRPWMLAWREDFGCSGFIEPDQAMMIVELMLTEGYLVSRHTCIGTINCTKVWFVCCSWLLFVLWPGAFCQLRLLTNSDLPGVEKVSTCSVPKEYLNSPYTELPSTIGGHPQTRCNADFWNDLTWL